MSARESFEWIADWAKGVAPLYERLARQTAEDETLLDIAAESMEGQPASNLLFGAVHALLLEGHEHPLAKFYSTCRENPADPEATDPFPAFRDFCLTHEERLREIVSSRRVQTNAVGRSAVLFPAFKHVVDVNTYGYEDAPRSIVGLLKQGGENAVEAIADEARERNIPVSTAILRGVPEDAILQYAHGAEADLIAMGTRGEVRDERLLGSTTARVVQRSAIPILTES